MGITRAFENAEAAWLAERPQWALWLPVGLGTGIAVYFAIPFEPSAFMGIAVSVAGFFAFLFTNSDIGRVAAAALTALAVGFTSVQWRTIYVAGPIIEKRTGPMQLTGTVEWVDLTENGARILVSEARFRRSDFGAPPRIVQLSIRSEPARAQHLLPGDRIRMTTILRPPPPPTMPGAFDFQRRAYFLGIGAYGFVLGDVTVLPSTARAPPLSTTLRRAVETVRLGITHRVRSLRDDESGAVAAALLTGQRGYIPEVVLQNMRDAGIAHLLAISGLHIGLVAGIVFAGVRFACVAVPAVGLRLNGKKAAALLAIPAAFAYAVLAGFTVPTERAFLMTGLMLLGVLMDRRALGMRSVAWAAAAVLILRPESLVGPGFQMSFAAVTALIAAYTVLSRRNRSSHNPGPAGHALRYFGGVLITTLIASAATAPFAIYHFQHAAAFGLLANAVAVPLAAFWVMPTGIATLAAMPFSLDTLPLQAMCAGVELILASAGYLAALPGAAVDIAAPPGWSIGLVTLAGLWLALWQGRWRLLGVPFLAVGLMGPLFATPPDIIIDGNARLVAVLHRDAAYLTSNNRSARFETRDWRQRMGHAARPAAWQNSAETAQGRLRCDTLGCTVTLGRGLVAISTNPATLADDCRRSWMIVATVPVRRSCKPPWGIIDRFDLWRYGTHAVTFTDKGPLIRTVNGARGRRPWVRWPDQ